MQPHAQVGIQKNQNYMYERVETQHRSQRNVRSDKVQGHPAITRPLFSLTVWFLRRKWSHAIL